jgi:ABC-type multidrug transport system fused ATPase/permease subunit
VENQTYYSNRILSCNDAYNKANRKYRLLGTLRLFTFILVAASLFLFWGSSFLMIPFLGFLILFLVFVNLSVNAKYLRDKQKKLREINEEEINVLNGDWLHFKEGNEYKDPQHAFSHDMDLFGRKSIYQLLNRTVSRKGSDLLANQLKFGTTSRKLTNEAILEFSSKMDWCQEFLAEGLVFEQDELDKEFQNITRIEYSEKMFGKFLRYCIPVSSIFVTILYSFDIITSPVFGMYTAILFLLFGSNLKHANRVSSQVTGFSSQVKMFKRQLELYKDLIIKSEELEKDRAKLFTNEQNLLDALNQLEKIQQRMEYRMNWPVGLVLNFYFAWDFRVLSQWEAWQRNNKQYIGQWEFQLAQIEVWISGSVYKFNYPETTFAEFSTTEEIRITGMGHPFVQRQKRVVNDVQLNVAENFLIITGPNMAGKSTYLRSLGLAFISANAGFPVLAENCEIPHLKLYSSMRTSDDLTVESSYFHAELTRLRFIMDAIEKGEKVFVILDEILKGTNSKDKEIGSAKFLQKLQRLNSKGVIATHDLSLCNLAEQSISFKNMYFDSTIEGNELAFDYKIRQGICKNMNASFLLKKMNLVDDNSI